MKSEFYLLRLNFPQGSEWFVCCIPILSIFYILVISCIVFYLAILYCIDFIFWSSSSHLLTSLCFGCLFSCLMLPSLFLFVVFCCHLPLFKVLLYRVENNMTTFLCAHITFISYQLFLSLPDAAYRESVSKIKHSLARIDHFSVTILWKPWSQIDLKFNGCQSYW